MSGTSINQVINQLVRGPLEMTRLQQLLATTFQQTNANPYWTFYEFELEHGPFAGGEFSLSKDGGKAWLSLLAREEPAVVERDFDPGQWGAVQNIHVNPLMPPEGTYTYCYNVEGVEVSFEFTQISRHLHGVAMQWPGVE